MFAGFLDFTKKMNDSGSKISYTFGCQRLKGGRNMETAFNAYYAANSLETQGGTLDVAAFGGLLGIRWDEDAKVTRWGGL